MESAQPATSISTVQILHRLSAIGRRFALLMLLLVIATILLWANGILGMFHVNETQFPITPRQHTLSGRTIEPYCKQIILKPSNKSISTGERSPWFRQMELSGSRKSGSAGKKRHVVRYLTTWNNGRLGNQLFGYASLFGIAWRNNSRRILLWNTDDYGLRQIFSRLRIPVDHKSPFREKDFTTIMESSTYPSQFIDATDELPPSNIHLDRYLQHERYFAHVEDQLRHDFTFSSDVMEEAQSNLDVVNASLMQNIGFIRVIIHVRLTDMTYNVDSCLLAHLADYLNRAMTHFTECLPRVHFIVASDDISWCRQNISLRDHRHRVDFIEGDRSPGVDLAIASLCNHAIITFGTYGWWIAWFANGVTIVPSQATVKVWRPPVSSRAVTLSLKWTFS